MNLSNVFSVVAALATAIVAVWVYRAPSITRDLSGWISVPIAVAGVMSLLVARTTHEPVAWVCSVAMVALAIGALGAVIVLVFTRPEPAPRPAPNESIGPDIERIP